MRISDWSSDVCSSDLRPEECLAWLRAEQADPLLAPERIGKVSVALLQSASARAMNEWGRGAEALPLALAEAEDSRKFLGPDDYLTVAQLPRLAERRVGKECGSRFMCRSSSEHYTKHTYS